MCDFFPLSFGDQLSQTAPDIEDENSQKACCYLLGGNRKQRRMIAFKKTAQNTQEIKYERFFNSDKTKQCADFRHYVAFNKATNESKHTRGLKMKAF